MSGQILSGIRALLRRLAVRGLAVGKFRTLAVRSLAVGRFRLLAVRGLTVGRFRTLAVRGLTVGRFRTLAVRSLAVGRFRTLAVRSLAVGKFRTLAIFGIRIFRRRPPRRCLSVIHLAEDVCFFVIRQVCLSVRVIGCNDCGSATDCHHRCKAKGNHFRLHLCHPFFPGWSSFGTSALFFHPFFRTRFRKNRGSPFISEAPEDSPPHTI